MFFALSCSNLKRGVDIREPTILINFKSATLLKLIINSVDLLFLKSSTTTLLQHHQTLLASATILQTPIDSLLITNTLSLATGQ